jgi:predicted alpha/beta-hydrolase family hydrolase
MRKPGTLLKKPSELSVEVGPGAQTTALVYPAEQPRIGAALILGHGAGAGQQSSFMTEFAAALAALGADIITFNFLYTEQKRKLPDRAPVLETCYRAVIDGVRDHLDSARHALFIGGKSMGGRIATQVAAADSDLPLAGLVLLGYPLHPPGRPDKLRDAHLPAVGRSVLFVQGSRDGFGTPDELQPIFARMVPTPMMYEVIGGDHSFKLTGRDPMRQRAAYEDIQREIVRWMALIAPTQADAR